MEMFKNKLVLSHYKDFIKEMKEVSVKENGFEFLFLRELEECFQLTTELIIKL